MTLEEIRAKFPQYNDLSDNALADGFYNKFYSDIPRVEFDAKIGLKPDTWEPASILPFERNLRTDETRLALPGMLRGIDDLASGKIPLQVADPETGEFHTNMDTVGPAMEAYTLGAGGAPFALKGAKAVKSALPKISERAPVVAKSQAAELFKDSGKLYDTLNGLGPYEDMAPALKVADNMGVALKTGRFSPERQQKAYSVVSDFRDEIARDGATPGTIEAWRRVIKRDLLKSSDGDLRDAGFAIMDELDSFVNSGIGGPAAKAARATFRKAVQVDKLEFAISQAERTAARGGKNFTHHLATQLQNLIKQDELGVRKGRPPQFDAAIRARLEKIADDKGGKILDWIGNASPDRRIGMILQVVGLGLTGGANLGLQAALGIGGYVAKRKSESASREAIEKLLSEIAQ
jgi:hypothetical protein